MGTRGDDELRSRLIAEELGAGILDLAFGARKAARDVCRLTVGPVAAILSPSLLC